MPTHPAQTSKTILVVDDDAIILQFVCDILAEMHYRVLSATSGVAAMQMVAEYPDEIHLLLSDFDMPKMTGMELATHLCVDRPNMKVLLMSGFPGGILLLNEGWHFLAKPFVHSQLKAIVTNLLNDGLPFDAASKSRLR